MEILLKNRGKKDVEIWQKTVIFEVQKRCFFFRKIVKTTKNKGGILGILPIVQALNFWYTL